MTETQPYLLKINLAAFCWTCSSLSVLDAVNGSKTIDIFKCWIWIMVSYARDCTVREANFNDRLRKNSLRRELALKLSICFVHDILLVIQRPRNL